MLYIKDVFKSCACSYCKNIYKYNSINENDFINSFKSFCNKDKL